MNEGGFAEVNQSIDNSTLGDSIEDEESQIEMNTIESS